MPATVSYDPATSVARLTPSAALQYGTTYTATVKGGSGGVTDYVGNPLAADVTWTFATEASPPQVLVVTNSANKFGTYLTEILLNEGLNAFTTLDVSLLSPGLLEGLRRRAARADGADGQPGIDAHELGQRRRQPDRDATGQATGRATWAQRCERDTGGGVHARRRVGGARDRDHRGHDAVPRHRRPVHARRRHGGRDALLEREHRDRESRGDAAVGRLERGPCGGVHLRPRPLGRLHAAGQPRVGRTGAGRRPRHPSRRPVLRRAGRRRAAGLGRHEQDRDPTGRRAAASAPQRGDAHGARQAAAAAVLVPASWREGRRRHERRRPLAGAGARWNGEPLRPLQAAEPGGMRGRELGVHPRRRRTSTPTASSPTRRRTATGPTASRSRCTSRSGRARRRRSPRRSCRRRSTPSSRSSRRSTRAFRRPRPSGRTASSGPGG